MPPGDNIAPPVLAGAEAIRGDAVAWPRSEVQAPSPREIAQSRQGAAARDDRVPLADPL